MATLTIDADNILQPLGWTVYGNPLPPPLKTRDYHEPVPGRRGEYDFGRDIDSRVINLRLISPWVDSTTRPTQEHLLMSTFNDTALVLVRANEPSVSYAVTLAGQIDPTPYGNYIDATVPLKMTDPYAYGDENSVTGPATIANSGNVPTAPTIEIAGAQTNPSVRVGGMPTITAAFTRATTAYKEDGTSVSSGVPRYEQKNLLTENQSSVETDTTGFMAWNSATISRSTSEKSDGNASLKVVTPGAVTNEGFYTATSAPAVLPSTAYAAQVQLKGSGTVEVNLIRVPGYAIIGSQILSLSSSWQRVTMSGTTAADTTSVYIRVGTTTAQAVTFYADCLQIELGSVASIWHLGGKGGAIFIEESVTNPVTNSGFETGNFTGWTTSGAQVSVDATKAATGTKSAKMVANSTNVYLWQRITVSPGQIWSVSADIETLVLVGSSSSFKVQWYNSGVYVSEAGSLGISGTSPMSKRKLENLTVPSGVNQLHFEYQLPPGTTSGTAWIDSIQAEQKPYATSYHDTARNAEVLPISTEVFKKSSWSVDVRFVPKRGRGDWARIWEMQIDANNYYALLRHTTDNMRGQLLSNGSAKSTALTPLIAETPYLATLSGDGSALRLMVNGAQIGSDVAYTEPVGVLPSNLYLGSGASGSSQANSQISEFRIRNVPTTLAQHQAYYDSALTVDDYTTLLMKFDESLVSTIDQAGSVLSWTGSVGAGETLIINCDKNTVKKGSTNCLKDYTGGFPSLSPGNTKVFGNATFKWRNRRV